MLWLRLRGLAKNYAMQVEIGTLLPDRLFDQISGFVAT